MRRLGLEPGGAVRVGIVHYNTAAEVDRLLAELLDLLDPGAPHERRRPLRQQRLDPEAELLAALPIAGKELDRQLLRAPRKHADTGDLRVVDVDRLAVHSP